MLCILPDGQANSKKKIYPCLGEIHWPIPNIAIVDILFIENIIDQKLKVNFRLLQWQRIFRSEIGEQIVVQF